MDQMTASSTSIPLSTPRLAYYSFDTTSFSDIDATVAAIMMTATAVRPTT
jgi:hypothetical protein